MCPHPCHVRLVLHVDAQVRLLLVLVLALVHECGGSDRIALRIHLVIRKGVHIANGGHRFVPYQTSHHLIHLVRNRVSLLVLGAACATALGHLGRHVPESEVPSSSQGRGGHLNHSSLIHESYISYMFCFCFSSWCRSQGSQQHQHNSFQKHQQHHDQTRG